MEMQIPSAAYPLVSRQPQAYSDEGAELPPSYMATCLPDLEALAASDSICIEQIVEGCRVFANCPRTKKYEITSSNDVFYSVTEETAAMSLLCLGPTRGFTMHVTDEILRTEVLTVQREFHPCMGLACCECCIGIAQQVTVTSHGTKLGTVTEKPQFIGNQLEIRGGNNELLATIEGPACLSADCCCSGVDFRITAPNSRTQIGEVSWQYLGCWTHCCTEKGCIVVNFTGQVDVQLKALVLGAAFLMDFRWFEVRRQRFRYLYMPIAVVALNLFCSAFSSY